MRRGGYHRDNDDADLGAGEGGENEPLVNRRSKATASKAKPKTKSASKIARGRSADVRGRSTAREVSPRTNVIGTSLPPIPATALETPPRQRSMEPFEREVSFEQLLQQFRQNEVTTLKKKRAASSSRSGRGKALTQDNLVALEEMQRLVGEMTKKYQNAEKRAEVAELEARRGEEQLADEARSRRNAEQMRAQAVARAEELEFAALKFQADREEWKQREAELQARGNSMWEEFQSRDLSALQARDERINELEELLKQAISRGANLGRANADIETRSADLERKISKIKASVKTRMRKERRRLEAIIISMSQRAERAEDRLVEYLDASTLGADALSERHMRHLTEVCHELAEKVDEQVDIIDALRTLLHDHKDFIRSQIVNAPHTASHTVHSVTSRPVLREPSALSALHDCMEVDQQPPDNDSVDLSIVSAQPPLALPSPPLQAAGDEESSVDSFDEEFFGIGDVASPALQQVMPSDSKGRDTGTARERRKKKDEDDEWPW